MNTFRLCAALLFIGCLVPRANASVTWRYKADTIQPPVTSRPVSGDLPSGPFYQLPADTPVSMDITFDPDTPANPLTYTEDSYVFSGGDTSLRFQIGTHVSNPISEFGMEVFQPLPGDSFNEVLLTGPGLGSHLDVEFPGYLEGGYFFGVFFAPRIGPNLATQDELPKVQPGPSQYIAFVAFEHYTGQNLPPGTYPLVTFAARFTSIPEPSGFVLGLLGLPLIYFCQRTLRG
jgi:hypothetical protein